MNALLLALLLAHGLGPTPGAPPTVPPGPTAGDLGAGWAAGLEVVEPRPGAQVPWLRGATAARLFIHRLPETAAEAQPRLVEAAAMILARHGRRFEHPAWDSWFRAQPWYRPRADYSPGLLTQGEREALGLLVQDWERLSPGGPTK